jgi:8-amino-7-oxononanoate synthase
MEEWSSELNLLKEDGLYRKLKTINTLQTPKTVVDGQEVIMLASNNYLGLTNNRVVKEATIEVIREYGTGSGGSRLRKNSSI